MMMMIHSMILMMMMPMDMIMFCMIISIIKVNLKMILIALLALVMILVVSVIDIMMYVKKAMMTCFNLTMLTGVSLACPDFGRCAKNAQISPISFSPTKES